MNRAAVHPANRRTLLTLIGRTLMPHIARQLEHGVAVPRRVLPR